MEFNLKFCGIYVFTLFEFHLIVNILAVKFNLS